MSEEGSSEPPRRRYAWSWEDRFGVVLLTLIAVAVLYVLTR
jgi:hypothetical protein